VRAQTRSTQRVDADAVVLTRNVRDFAQTPVRIETY
jgi:hypothetical protein